MAVSFDMQNIVEVLAQAFFSGSMQMAGISILLAVLLVFVVVFAAIRAPVQYSLIPALLVAIFFGAYGIIDPSVSFLIIVLSAVIVASTAKDLIVGGR